MRRALAAAVSGCLALSGSPAGAAASLARPAVPGRAAPAPAWAGSAAQPFSSAPAAVPPLLLPAPAAAPVPDGASSAEITLSAPSAAASAPALRVEPVAVLEAPSAEAPSLEFPAAAAGEPVSPAAPDGEAAPSTERQPRASARGALRALAHALASEEGKAGPALELAFDGQGARKAGAEEPLAVAAGGTARLPRAALAPLARTAAASAAVLAQAVPVLERSIGPGPSLLLAAVAAFAAGVALWAFPWLAKRWNRVDPDPVELRADAKGLFALEDGPRLFVREDQLGRPFLLRMALEGGLGEKDLYAAEPLQDHLVYFRRFGDELQLVARNTDFRADPGSPEAALTREGFSDSVLASAPILRRARSRGKRAWSVDASALFGQDLANLDAELGGAYPEMEYLPEKGLGRVRSAKSFPRNLEIGTEYHFRSRSYDASAPVPDARSLFLSVRYSLMALPEAGFESRPADDRVGYFMAVSRDFSRLAQAEPGEAPHTRLINRWRLEKRDPSAAASPVVKPIVFWIEHTVPAQYREAVRRGALAWNQAFERVGLLGAIEVRDQPAPGEPGHFDAGDVRRSMIRWYVGKDADKAFGMSSVDPRTGEIYAARIQFTPDILRGVGYRGLREALGEDAAPADRRGHRHGRACAFGAEAARAMALERARGGDPAERERFAQELIASYIVHEVGHTLGLRHNFAASSFRTLDEIAAAQDGILSQSVMDYAAVSFPAIGNAKGAHVQVELGPYDFLAIEYGYKPLAGATEEARRAELGRIAARVGEPGLEYASDEQVNGMDPYAAQFDLGPEPLEFARRSVERATGAWQELAERELPAGTDYRQLSRQFWLAFRFYYRKAFLLAVPYVGGMRYHRSRAGENAGRPPYEPIPARRQKDALAFLNRRLFSDDALVFPPAFLARLAPDARETVDDYAPEVPAPSFGRALTELRALVLRRLLDPARLRRMGESRHLLEEGERPYTVHALLESLEHMVWGEYMLNGPDPLYRNASPLRRDQQSAHLDVLLDLEKYHGDLAEESGSGEQPSPESVRAAYASLLRLHWNLRRALKSGALDQENREHVRHALSRIKDAVDKP